MRTTGRRRGGRTVRGMVKRMAVVLVAAAALAMPGIARAHGGHTHTIRGTITERSDARVSIKQTDGKVVVVTLNAKTALTRGDKKVDAAALGDELGIDEEEMDQLEQGAYLHDIGKLAMPASILSKPAPLDEREWQVMRTHPQVGYDLLRAQPRFVAAAEIVLSHHEAYDGSGYPRGLRESEIPRPARVLAVADAYDSMTLPHTQRPPLPPALAVDEIERCSGSQFDPECAAALGPVLARAVQEPARRPA